MFSGQKVEMYAVDLGLECTLSHSMDAVWGRPYICYKELECALSHSLYGCSCGSQAAITKLEQSA